jgi:hypothetical protein
MLSFWSRENPVGPQASKPASQVLPSIQDPCLFRSAQFLFMVALIFRLAADDIRNFRVLLLFAALLTPPFLLPSKAEIA